MENQYFTLKKLFTELELSEMDRAFVHQSLISERKESSQNLNHLIGIVEYQSRKYVEAVYTLLPNSIVQYVDYFEIKEARKSAKDANLNSATIADYMRNAKVMQVNRYADKTTFSIQKKTLIWSRTTLL